eukprot:6472913-Lingulodinium_polyedra.AAC.1
MAEAEGDSELRREPKPLRTTDYLAMKKSFEDRWWAVDDKKQPGKAYVEKILEGIEKGELRAEPVTDAIHTEEDEPSVLKAIWGTSGALKA